MERQANVGTRRLAYDGVVPLLSRLVMGVHWSPAADRANAADLDALCVLYGAERRVLEVIHGGRLRNANESVVHTGDSCDGANCWDDERIFVFADALPETVERLDFVVVCADGRAFHEVPGAICHVTDPASECEWLRLDLTALRARRSQTVATLHRVDGAWSLSLGDSDATGGISAG
jgi:stress response protein SCP2